MNLELSNAFGADCILVVVWKNSEPDVSYFALSLLKSSLSVLRSLVFHIIGRFHHLSLYLSQNYCFVCLLSESLKVSEKLVSND